MSTSENGWNTGSRVRLAHVGLTVPCLDRAVAFYMAALGAEVTERGSSQHAAWAFLEVGGVEALTLWQLPPGEGGAAGLHHLGFEVDGEVALRAAQQLLEALDTPFVYGGVVPHAQGATSAGLFFLDGDGLQVEIFADGLAADQPAPNAPTPTCGFF